VADQNPPVSSFLRFFTLFELVVLAAAGAGLFFFSAIIRPIWPWDISPFNAAFIGAIYLASVPAIGTLALVGRWAPGRVVLPMLLTFTGIGLVATLLSPEIFQYQRWTTWLWFFIYIALPVNSAVHLWIYRRQAPALAVPTPTSWRTYLLAQGAVLILYGLIQFVAPVAASAFWP